MKKILIVDAQPVVRIGLAHILEAREEPIDLFEAGCSNQAVAILHAEPCDGVIIDVDVDGQGGIDLIKRIRRQHRSLPVLVFTDHPEERLGVRALRAGASGFVNKRSAPDAILEAVEKLLSGNFFLSSNLAEELAHQVTGRRSTRAHTDLSDREFQIVSMIGRGRTASQIADELKLSVKTVHTHRARALRKLGLANNSQLTHYAFRNGLVD